MKVKVGTPQEKTQQEYFEKTMSKIHFLLIALMLLLLDVGIVVVQFDIAVKGVRKEITDTVQANQNYMDTQLERYLALLQLCATYVEHSPDDLAKWSELFRNVFKETENISGTLYLPADGEGVVYLPGGIAVSANQVLPEEEQQKLMETRRETLQYYTLSGEDKESFYLLAMPLPGGKGPAVVGFLLKGLDLLQENQGEYLCEGTLSWEGIYRKSNGEILFEKQGKSGSAHLGNDIVSLDYLNMTQEEIATLLNTQGIDEFRDNERKTYYIYVQQSERWDYAHVYAWGQREIWNAYFGRHALNISILCVINLLILVGEQIWHFRVYKNRIYQRLKNQMANDSIFHYVLDSKKIFLMCLNDRYEVEEASETIVEELCDLPMEEVVGSNLFFLLKVPKLKEFVQEFKESREDTKDTVMPFYGRKNRKRTWYFIEIQSILGMDGELHYLLMFLTATDMLVAERVIKSVMQNTQDFMLILDEQHNVQYISAEALRRLGLTDEGEVAGRPSKELPVLWLGGRDLEEVLCEVTRYHSFDATLYVENREEHTEGWWANVNAFALSRENESYGKMLILKDITEFLKKAEETEKANKIKENLLYTVSHGVKTPLNVLLGSTDMLLSKMQHNAEEDVYLQNIKQAVKELVGMLDEVLDFTKLDSESLVLQEKEFSVMKIVDALAFEAFHLARGKNLAYYTKLSADLPQTIYADEEWLKKTLSNLLQIFIAMTDNGFVKLIISCEEGRYEEKYLHFELQGTGTKGGNTESGAFYRRALTENMNYDSTEILCEFKYYICRDVVHLMGSELENGKRDAKTSYLAFDLPLKTSAERNIVDCTEFAGKTIAFLTEDETLREHCMVTAQELQLTVKKPEQAEYLVADDAGEYEEVTERSGRRCVLLTDKQGEKTQYEVVLQRPFTLVSFAQALRFGKAEGKKEETGGKTVSAVKGIQALVVDDNEVNRMIAVNMLKLLGAATDQAADGMEAVEAAKKKDYDLILMDHLMPNMDGVRATKAIRALGGHNEACLIFALTADLMDRVSKMFAEAGATEALAKPLELKTLKEKLAHWLPEDKVILEKKESEEATSKQEENRISLPELKAVFAVCPEIHIDKGLSYLQGNEEQYCKVLSATVRSLEECLEKLQKAVATGKELRIVLHSMKGMYFGIGAEEPAREAAELEAAAAEEKEELLKEKLPAFTEKATGLARRLSDIFQEEEEEEETLVISEEAYEQAYQDAVVALKMFNIDVALETLKVLVAASEGEKRERMKEAKKHAENFDYDEALAILESL